MTTPTKSFTKDIIINDDYKVLLTYSALDGFRYTTFYKGKAVACEHCRINKIMGYPLSMTGDKK